MQFAPGKRWAYNNSGYILLGAIIEKISGQTYAQFIQQSIFDPLGMTQSYYDNPRRMIPRRVASYDKGPEGYTNAAYVSMTQPYAAGALASTVDDLARWDSALYTEHLLKQETLQRAFVSQRLIDGSSTAYGYGWGISESVDECLAGDQRRRRHAITQYPISPSSVDTLMITPVRHVVGSNVNATRCSPGGTSTARKAKFAGYTCVS
jgi:CubicO group peptidase (beta-lactamase class C family)